MVGQPHPLLLGDRAGRVALLGSLLDAEAANRFTVVFDRGDVGTGGEDEAAADPYPIGARAADSASHPALRAQPNSLVDLGHLSRCAPDRDLRGSTIPTRAT